MTRPDAAVSIVIPSYNRRELVTNLVVALFEQPHGDDPVELIVVLDGSSDGSAEALGKLNTPPGMNLTVVTQANRGRAAARNAGLARATGHVVIFLDDDVVPGPCLIAAHCIAHRSVDAVLGRIEHMGFPGVPAAISAQEVSFYRDRHQHLSSGTAITALDVFAGNLSVKLGALRRIGGFDETFTGYGCEDWDLGQRLMEAGVRFAYAADAMVWHRSETTMKQWRRHARQEGRSQLAFIGKHPQLASGLDISGLQAATWPGRFLAQMAIQSPRIGLAASTVLAGASTVTSRVLTPHLQHRVAYQSWRLAFWAGVRETLGSSQHTRDACRFAARILCYHRVCDAPNPALAPWAVEPDEFRAQMAYLKRAGFRAVTLEQLMDAFDSGRPLDRLVAITFDDGYLDTFTTAAPILQAFGFPATLFVVPRLVGATAAWDAEFGGPMAPLATWTQVRALQDAGWEIGFHTTSHLDITTITDTEAEWELLEGRNELDANIGRRSTSFAYPFGEFAPHHTAMAASAGWRVAVSMGSRLATPTAPRHAMERVAVLRRHRLDDFKCLLHTGYDRRGLVAFGVMTPLRAIRGLRRPSAQPA